MKIRMLGATAIAALMVAVAAPAAMAPVAFAQTTPAAPVLTKQMVKPYNEALQAIQAKDYATAQTKINEANAQAKTPVDKGQVERLKLQVAIDTKNVQGQVTSVNALLSSATLTPEETKQYKGALIKMYQDSGDAVNSAKALRAYVDEYSGTADNYIAVADGASKANDHATAVLYADKAIKASSTAVAPESWYRLYLRSLKAAGQDDKYYTELEGVVQKYPKEDLWRLLFARTQTQPGFSKDLNLDLYRALQATGANLNEQERSRAAAEALRRGLPGEAQALLETVAATSETDKTNLADAKKQSASDKAGLAKETKDTMAKGSGADLALIGEAQLTYGDNAKAVEVLKAAIAKGISDPGGLAAAKLHLGIAQYRSNDKAGAKATWAEVQSTDGAGSLAHIWTLIADSKA